MTPEEKWARLNNPTCADDYGLSISETELRTFLEGREILLNLRKIERKRGRTSRLMSALGKSMGERIDGLVGKEVKG